MADENREHERASQVRDEPVVDEGRRQQAPSSDDREDAADRRRATTRERDPTQPPPSSASCKKDYTIPGVEPDDPDPYKWHTGEKRDHGGEDAIEVIDLVKQFGNTRIQNGLNLGLPDNKVSMVLGPSGTGKSVLIKLIVGLLYPDSGDMLVHGESVPNMSDDELFEMRKKFGLLFQDGALFGSMNIFDNTAFPLRQHTDKSEDEIEEIVSRRLDEVGLSRGAVQDAERALGRDAQARRLRPRAGARPGDRLLRRAGLGPRPGPHGAAVRADPRDPRGERRLLHGDQPRPRHRPPDRRLHRRPLEGPDRRVGPPRSCSSPTTSSSTSSSTPTSRARWRWTEPDGLGARC